MRWEDERYVRLYTRDTITWKMLPWQGKALLPLLMRKVDRAGLIDVGEHGPDGLAALVELPVEVVNEGLAALIKCKTAHWTGGGAVLFLPSFLEAQEAHQTDAQRKRDQRERVAAKAKLDQFIPAESHAVTECHKTGQDVTVGHTKSHEVTGGHSDLIRSEPSLAVVPPTEGAPGGAVQGLLSIQEPPKSKQKKQQPNECYQLVEFYEQRWVSRFKPENGAAPKSKAAFGHAKALIAEHGLDVAFKYVAQFIADDDLFIAKRGHQFVDIASRVPAYKKAANAPPTRGGLPLSTSIDPETAKLVKF